MGDGLQSHIGQNTMRILEKGEKREGKKYISSDHINTSLHHTSVLGMVFVGTEYNNSFKTKKETNAGLWGQGSEKFLCWVVGRSDGEEWAHGEHVQAMVKCSTTSLQYTHLHM